MSGIHELMLVEEFLNKERAVYILNLYQKTGNSYSEILTNLLKQKGAERKTISVQTEEIYDAFLIPYKQRYAVLKRPWIDDKGFSEKYFAYLTGEYSKDLEKEMLSFFKELFEEEKRIISNLIK